MVNESESNAALAMDRGLPLGNSEDIDGRRAIHVKIKNKLTEAITILVPGVATEATLLQVRDRLVDISGYVDELETLTAQLVTINTAISTSVDGLEALNTAILAAVDQLESLLTTLNTSVDGVEALITATNTALASILAAVDQLETYTDQIEGLITAGNASLTTLVSQTDSIEASLISIDAGTPAALGQTTMVNSQPVVLPSDQFRLDLTGYQTIQTWLAAMNQLNRVFSATTGLISISGTAEVAFLYLINPSASGKTLYIFRSGIGVVTNRSTFRFYFGPTVTANGTAITPVNQRRVGTPATSVATPFYSSTTTSFGTNFRTHIQATGVPSTEMNFNELIILGEGKSILVSVQNFQNNVDSHASLWWVEI